MKRKLLSVLLTLCLAFSLLPTAALAATAENCPSGESCTHQAAIGSTHYDTLQDAVNAAKKNDEIELLQDITENVTIPSTLYTVTIDLNGKRWSGGTDVDSDGNATIHQDKAALTNYGAHTYIKDSVGTGIITRDDTGVKTNANPNTSYYVIDNIKGVLTIQGGTIYNDSDYTTANGEIDGSSVIRNGGVAGQGGPVLTIAGGRVYQDDFIAVKNDEYGTLWVTGGTVESKNSTAILNWKTATIKNSAQVNGVINTLTYNNTNGKTTIDGTATVNGMIAADKYDKNTTNAPKVLVTGGNLDIAWAIGDASVQVTGGTFTKQVPDAYYGDGYEQSEENGKYTITKENVAQVGNQKYTTMDEAFKAQTTSNKPIVLLRDYTTGLPFPSGSINRTVDLNGHTWTYTGTDANSAAFEINYPDVTLTVKNGKIASSQLVGLIPTASSYNGTITYDNSSLVFDGVEMSTTATSGIETNGNNTDDSVTLKNSTLNVSNGFGIYFPSSGTLTIDNSTINAKTMGVQVCAGSLNINDGSKITVTGDAVPKTEGDGAIQDGAAISIVNRSGYKGLGNIAVTGGTFTAKDTNAAIKAYDWNNTNQTEDPFTESTKVSVSGGTFTSAVPENCCAPGFVPTQNGNTHGVKINENEAMVAEVLDAQGNIVGAYNSLAAAIAALPYNTDNTAPAATTTIKLLCDTNGGFDFGDAPRKVVNASLDLNNNTLTLGPAIGSTNTETNGIRVLAYSKLEIKNGTIKCSDEVSNDGRKVKVGLANYGTAVLEDIVFKSGTYDIWTVNNRGDLTLKGNTTVETGTNSDTTDNPTLTRAAINNTPYDYFYNGVNAVINVADATVEVGKIVLNDETISASINTNGKAVLNLSAGTFGEISETKPGNGIEGNITGGKFSSDPSVYVVGNGNTNIVKRDGSEGAYTYTVLAKSGLTSGVYLTDPSGALASNYYVSSTANGVWTVSYSAPYSGGSSSYDPTYSVSTPSKTENGSVTVSPKNASKGDTVTVTVKPDSGYVLETLTVTDKNGNELTLKDKGNGKYTFTMPAGKVEVKATFMEDNSMLNFFYDVPNNAYFYEAVKWAVENGITTGVGNDLFAPEQPCTRAQIVTFLWRAAGSPEPKGAASGMTDVVSGSYYEKAVAWAIENGITTGTTTSTFSPDATCTRAQAVTFLARALKAKAASAAEFSDVPTGSYFADAVAWAAANGVTEGIGGGLFGSDNDCTRGQIVTFLYRAYNK